MSPATAGSRGNNTTNSVETDTSSANITPLGKIFHILYITETATIPLPLRPQHGIGVSENIMFLINFSDITIYEQFVEELLSGIRDHFRPVDWISFLHFLHAENIKKHKTVSKKSLISECLNILLMIMIHIAHFYDILDKRIYSEHSDTEMDIWIKILVPHQTGKLCSFMNRKRGERRERSLVEIEIGLIYCLSAVRMQPLNYHWKPSRFPK